MRDFHWRRWSVAATLCLSWAAAHGADDDDALALQPEMSPEAEHEAALGGTKFFFEGEIGRASQRYELGSRTIGRVAADFRSSFRPTSSTRVVLSARADDSDPSDPRIDGTVFSFREAYVGWQDDTATRLVEFGRINLREGPGYGYNPTDFFRDNALRTISTVNPFSLREQRIGSVMLRAQQLWSSGSVAFAFSPKLESSGRSDEGFSLDLGSTNARNRGLMSVSSRLSEKVNTQLTAYKEAGTSLRIGANLTALLSEAAVAHAEWSYSREPNLLAHALADSLATGAEKKSRQRGVAGLTYTTASNLSVTAEYQYNGFALSRRSWQSLGASVGPAAQGAYFEQAVALQDIAARDAILLYVVQRDLLFKKLDLTVLLTLNCTDRSDLIWIDLRYRMERFDIAFRAQHNSGAAGSEFGIASIRRSASVVGIAYF